MMRHLKETALELLTDSLMDWAEANGIHCPRDRPWLQADPPAIDVITWDVWCRCDRAPVRLARYGREHGVLYVGQCRASRNCQAIIWCLLPKGA